MRTSKKIIECRHYLKKIIDKYDDIENNEYKLEDYKDFIVEHPKEHKEEKDDVEKIRYKSYLYWFYVVLFLFIFFIFLAIILRYLSNREVVAIEQPQNIYVPIEAPPAVVKGGKGRRFRK